MAGNQGHAAFGPEVHIGLVHNHHVVGVGVGDGPDGFRRQGQAGGGVGVGDDNGLVPAVVFQRVQAEIPFQGDDILGDVEQPAPDGVAAISNIGMGQGMIFIAEGPQGEKQVFVAAVARHDLVGLQAVIIRRLLPQGGAGRVGIELKPAGLLLDGLQHRRGRRIGAFVGVQLDIGPVLGLFPGGVGLQIAEGGAEKAAHRSAPPSPS